MAQKRIGLATMQMQDRSLHSLSGLRIRRCQELWCRSQVQLDLALLWLWYRRQLQFQFNPQPGNFHMLWMQP